MGVSAADEKEIGGIIYSCVEGRENLELGDFKVDRY